VNCTTQTSDYVHDLAGRLGTVTVDGALIADYAYDSNSNRVGVMQAGAGIPMSGCAAGLSNVSATVDVQDRLLTYGTCQYQYTDNGELNHKTDSASSAQTSYQYDSFSNLRHVNLPDGRAIDYQIDGRNRRIGKSINGVAVQGLVYLNDLEPVAETDPDGNRIATFIYADRANTPSYLLKGGNVYRVIADHLGSVRLVVNVADGSIAQRLDYDAWGRVLTDSNPGFQPFGFAGGIYDRDTGLVRFGARDYDPETGRWTNKDPIGFGGGDSNVMLYVANDPINFVDPSGLLNPVKALVAAAVGLNGIRKTASGGISAGLATAGVASGQPEFALPFAGKAIWDAAAAKRAFGKASKLFGEAYCESAQDASLENLYGAAPFGDNFDDQKEPGPTEWFKDNFSKQNIGAILSEFGAYIF